MTYIKDGRRGDNLPVRLRRSGSLTGDWKDCKCDTCDLLSSLIHCLLSDVAAPDPSTGKHFSVLFSQISGSADPFPTSTAGWAGRIATATLMDETSSVVRPKYPKFPVPRRRGWGEGGALIYLDYFSSVVTKIITTERFPGANADP